MSDRNNYLMRLALACQLADERAEAEPEHPLARNYAQALGACSSNVWHFQRGTLNSRAGQRLLHSLSVRISRSTQLTDSWCSDWQVLPVEQGS